MNQEILRADVRLRRVSLVVLALGSVLVVLALYAFQLWLVRTTREMPTAQLVVQLRAWTGAALMACGACLLLLAAYAARLSRRVVEQGRWPLEGARVLQDTPVRRGAPAAKTARSMNAMAIALAVLAMCLGAISLHIFGVSFG